MKVRPYGLPSYMHSIFYDKKTLSKYLEAGWIALPARNGTRLQIDIVPGVSAIVRTMRRPDRLTKEMAAILSRTIEFPCTLLGSIFEESDKRSHLGILDLIALNGVPALNLSFALRRNYLPSRIKGATAVSIERPTESLNDIGQMITSPLNSGVFLLAPFKNGFRFRVFVHRSQVLAGFAELDL